MKKIRIEAFRKISMTLAEATDAWRIVPRAILFAYGWLVWEVTRWYMSIPSVNLVECQPTVLQSMLDARVPLQEAARVACNITDTIGGPTSEQTMFVSIIAGLSSVVIGLYLNTGKTSRWTKDHLSDRSAEQDSG